MGPNGEETETAAVLTTEANRTLMPIHHRMPVVIPPEAFDMWLDCANVDALTAAALLVAAPDDLMEAYEISTAVNRVANDGPEVIAPVSEAAAPETAPPDSEKVRRGDKRSKTDRRQPSLFD